MIRKILLALDSDKDTPVAMHYAFDIAHRVEAQITGFACIDTKRIDDSASGGGIGSMHYAEKLRKKLETETREEARELLERFAKASMREHVAFTQQVRDGAPSARIIEEMRYHELLIIGNDPHFFYGHPDEHTTTLAHVVKGSVAPVLVVPDTYRPIKTVMLAYDGSAPSARAMQMFALFSPFGKDLDVHVARVSTEADHEKAELEVRSAADYLQFHGFTTHTATLQGHRPVDHLIEHAESIDADLLVAGAHSVSMVRKLAFGSTTESLIDKATMPIFMER